MEKYVCFVSFFCRSILQIFSWMKSLLRFREKEGVNSFVRYIYIKEECRYETGTIKSNIVFQLEEYRKLFKNNKGKTA